MLTFLESSKRFGKVQALDGCSFSVERGRMLGGTPGRDSAPEPNEQRGARRAVRAPRHHGS
jgi:hypothetical protein